MVVKIPGRVIGKAFLKWELVLKDTFNWELLYKRLHDYLPEKKWRDLYKGKADFEILYYEKDKGGGAINQDIWWRAYRKPKKNAGGRFMFYMKMDFKTLLIKKTEIMVDGKKVKIDKGELGVNCWFYLDDQADIDGDFSKKDKSVWDTNFILKMFKNWFWNRDRAEEREFAEEELRDFSNNLQHLLEVYTGAKEEEGPRDFLTKKGVKP
ncbi:MAG: hypothetical protein U9R00_02630 [Patescibacteria group bacterium]|nr:hypothetical protein [Patescibacteria group bacterium]